MKKFKKLKPVETLSLVDKVELRLLEFFKDNDLKPGDSIPKELEFAASLGVSRTVIREALLRLRTLGLIKSKKHSGMILTEPDIIANFERILDPSLLGMDVLKNLFELRLILEMGMADFLFERKTQKDLEELEEIVNAEEEEEARQISFGLGREIDFHGKLYEISQNKTLLRFQKLLLPVFEYVHLKNKPEDFEYRYSSGNFVTHKMLVNQLKSGTPETFRDAMRQHLEPHFDSIFNQNENTLY